MSKSGGKSDFRGMQNKFAKGKTGQSQMSGIARSNMGPIPKLVFKQAKALSKDEVSEICKAHGNVLSVRECTKSGYKFVELASEAEMVAMLQKLNKTHYDLNVCIDSRFKNSSEFAAKGNTKETKNRKPEEMNNLTKKTVQYKATSQMSGTYSDPKEFVQNLDFGKCAQCDRACNTICYRCSTNYCGRKCQNEAWPDHRRVCDIPKKPEEMNNLTKKTEEYKATCQMSGTYSDPKEFVQNLDFGKCAQCDRACNTICYRCSTNYCGRKCQNEAWPDHRRVCDIPKSVIRTVK